MCNRPTRGIGSGAAKYIREMVEAKSTPPCKISLFAAVTLIIKEGFPPSPSGKKLGVKQQNALKKFVRIVEQIADCATQQTRTPMEIIDFAIKTSNYLEYLKKKQALSSTTQSKGKPKIVREDNLEELKKRAQTFSEEMAKEDEETSNADKTKGEESPRETLSLQLFLDWLNLQNPDEDTLEEGKRAQKQDVVSMTTIHQAKGLEWPVGNCPFTKPKPLNSPAIYY